MTLNNINSLSVCFFLGALRRSNPASNQAHDGLLRCARNDEAEIRFEYQTADTRPHSRGGRRPRFACRCPSNWREQEMPDARCTRGPVCKMGKENAHEHTGSAEDIRHSLRNGFTAYFALLAYPRPVG